MLHQLGRLRESALDFMFPRRCVGCGREGDFLCVSCLHSLSRIAPPICPECGRPQSSGILCPGCINRETNIDGIRSPFRFEGVIRKAIHEFKYHNLRALSVPFAHLLSEYLLRNNISGNTLVAVPLHHKRLRERGYNQAELLALELGKLAGMPVVNNCLVRLRQNSPQARTLTVKERHENVAGAFSCRGKQLEGKHVILIDDVATSGATLDACAGALKVSGVISVWGVTVAREI